MLALSYKAKRTIKEAEYFLGCNIVSVGLPILIGPVLTQVILVVFRLFEKVSTEVV